MISLLVITHDPGERERWAACAAARGWTLKTTSSATTGLGIARWFRPLVVVIDLFAEPIDAAQISTLVHADPHLAHTLIYAVDDAEDPRHRELAARAAIDELIVRPFDIPELADRIAARTTARVR